MKNRAVRLEPLGEQIADDLRSKIIYQTIPAGERLVETEVARQYDVSRGPVRDAFMLLMNEGLIEKKRQSCVVRGLSEKDVRDMYEVRVAFEEIAVTHIVSDISSISWKEMDDCITRMDAAIKANDTNRYAQEDLDFHDELIKSSKNERVIDFWSTLMPIFSVMLQVTNAEDEDLTPSFDDHVVILNSLKAGKTADVKTLIDRHLEGSLNRMVRALDGEAI
ncbi:GntR family transcriptional regulator [Bifidobacterium sp. ESL0732]|uniref:GntR family transcriptional regulator n=1 Tax=Bifidobacterium sp. ESL0732 TaxID=2983222 RepID=UPI0023F85D83|nr:GntR family transcriptional regulator [Bifidobacterium sp. ESL0732]WEV64703.1 GntR family transcriptional regulator [Bifidobacterium sp. ESL0732]